MSIGKIIRILEKAYGRTFFLPKGKGNSPYYVLVSCILSQRTKDEVTYPAANRLFEKADTPERMLKLKTSQIEKLIYPAGFYKTKAKTIKEVSRQLIDDYKGGVPDEMDELTRLKGVGRKTAGIVLTHAYKIPALPIDSHCHRIANRLGWIGTKTPEQTEMELMRIIPEKYWVELNELLVKHGQGICRPISPFCSKCPIGAYCKKVGVTSSR